MSPARAGSSASRACSAWTPCIGRVGAAASSPSSVDSTRRSAPSPAGSSSPMRGHTTYACRPPRTSSPTRAQVRSIQPGRSSGTTWVVIGARPAGSSRSVEVSRSPKTVIATVRGIGVAVMTRTCGGSFPLPRNASRCSTPNRCCSSTTTRARSRKSTCSSRRAWVPTTMPGVADRDVEQRLAPLGGRLAPGEEDDPGRVVGAAEHPALGEVAEHPGDRAVVLRREDLGGREQRGLAAGVDRREHRPQRDDRLARADLALEQPVHRHLAAPSRPRRSRRPRAARR